MPERIYMDRRPGQYRIHIELAENEILNILDDLHLADDAYDDTKALYRILVEARGQFEAERREFLGGEGL